MRVLICYNYKMSIIVFTNEEMSILASRDEKMAKAIEVIGPINREAVDDVFTAIIESIVSQQLSGKVADIICKRLHNLLGIINPSNIMKTEDDVIKSVGLSYRKVSYIKGVANAVINGSLDIDNLQNLSDREVIDELVKLKGIGEWTAEMLLIFALKRKDVLSLKDLGIRRGIEYLYDDQSIDIVKLKNKFSPLNSLASLYLWEIAGKGREWVIKNIIK